jgi:hypothetical protein
LKYRANALPTPASVPGAVDQNVGYFVIPHQSERLLHL